MPWSLLADVVMVVHFAFAAFVALGGLVVLVRPKVAWFHLPALLYGIAIELKGWVCPLTPLEWDLRARAGEAGIEGSFLERYLDPILYPADWDRLHVWLGVVLLVFNAALYAALLMHRRKEIRRSIP